MEVDVTVNCYRYGLYDDDDDDDNCSLVLYCHNVPEVSIIVAKAEVRVVLVLYFF